MAVGPGSIAVVVPRRRRRDAFLTRDALSGFTFVSPFIVGFVLFGWFASRAPAQATQPLTAPGTAPAVAADTTTPKGTLKLLSAAMEQGDAEAMRRLMLAADPVEQRMVAAQVGQAEAFARFRHALVATFGKPALDELLFRFHAGQGVPASGGEDPPPNAGEMVDLLREDCRAPVEVGQLSLGVGGVAESRGSRGIFAQER